MKVLQVTKVFWPVLGGVQGVARRICQGLCDSMDFTVLTTGKEYEPARELEYAAVLSERSYGQLFSMPVAPAVIWRLITMRSKFDLLVVHYPFPLADVAIALCPFKLPPIVVYWHSEVHGRKTLAKLVRPFTARMLKKAAKIVVASPLLFDHSVVLGSVRDKVTSIPFGYTPRQSFSGALDPGDRFLVVGRHVAYKGFSFLLHAAQYTDARFVLVGDGPMLAEHQDLARQLGVDQRVEFQVGVGEVELEKLFRSCRALILPSVYPSEAFGLVQLEAMAVGRPVINTRLASAVPWVARDMKEALTVEPGDVAGLAAAITRLSEDQQLYQALSENAYRRWRKNFREDDFISKTGALFRETADNAETMVAEQDVYRTG